MVERASASKRRVQAGWVAIVLVLALVGAGCGSSTTDGGLADTTATTEPGPPLLDEAALKSALLTLADLPPDMQSGWITESLGPQVAGELGVFCDSAAAAVGGDPTPMTRTDFFSLHALVGQALVSVLDADEMWQSKREAIDSCIGQTSDVGGSNTSLEAVAAPPVGDEAVAYRVTHDDPNAPTYTEFVLARRGSVVQFYSAMVLSDGEQAFPPADFEELVVTGDRKVAAVLAGTAAPAPTVTKPSCDEVQAAIGAMSAADLTALKKAPMLFFSRLPGSGDGWRITALGDVTGTAPRPDVVVYYDWTPTSGLGPPVVVLNPDDLEVLQGDDTSVTLIGMNCINATVNVSPSGSSPTTEPVRCRDAREGHLPSETPVDLSWCDLSRADLSGADLVDADLQNADLSYARLDGASLSGAGLHSANLSFAKLVGADLSDADLGQTDLRGADLTDAHLNGASMAGANLTNATWSNTTCPDGSNSDSHGDTCVGYGI